MSEKLVGTLLIKGFEVKTTIPFSFFALSTLILFGRLSTYIFCFLVKIAVATHIFHECYNIQKSHNLGLHLLLMVQENKKFIVSVVIYWNNVIFIILAVFKPFFYPFYDILNPILFLPLVRMM